MKSIANQISGILDEVHSLANTSYQGQYIFAGGQDVDGAVHHLDGDFACRDDLQRRRGCELLETPNGQKIQLNVPGSQIFRGSGANSVFGALEQPGGRLFERHGEYRAGGERYGGAGHGAELRLAAARDDRQLA